jgi:hypothetical protein
LKETDEFYTHSGHFRTLAEYSSLLYKKNLHSTIDPLQGEKLYAFKIVLRLINLLDKYESINALGK